jgi:hypothetical protein
MFTSNYAINTPAISTDFAYYQQFAIFLSLSLLHQITHLTSLLSSRRNRAIKKQKKKAYRFSNVTHSPVMKQLKIASILGAHMTHIRR